MESEIEGAWRAAVPPHDSSFATHCAGAARGAAAGRYSAADAGTRMSRLPFDCIDETMPAFSMSSSSRAARL